MQTKFVIKGSVKHIFPDENLAYFVCVKDDVVWNNQTFGVRHVSATIEGATLYDTYQEALDTIQENELHGFMVFPVCPRCHKDYDGHPAISRKDNKTELCSDCGTQEALFDFIHHIKNKPTI